MLAKTSSNDGRHDRYQPSHLGTRLKGRPAFQVMPIHCRAHTLSKEAAARTTDLLLRREKRVASVLLAFAGGSFVNVTQQSTHA